MIVPCDNTTSEVAEDHRLSLSVVVLSFELWHIWGMGGCCCNALQYEIGQDDHWDIYDCHSVLGTCSKVVKLLPNSKGKST